MGCYLTVKGVDMQREMFEYELREREGIRSLKEGRNPLVKAVRYAPGLIIHSALCNSDRGLRTDYYWTVAHEPSGFGIVLDVPKRIARYVAATLATLPVDWTPQKQADFISQFQTLPDATKQLVHQIRKADYSQAA